MNAADVLGLVNDRLLPLYDEERQRLDTIDRWYRFDPEAIKLPRAASEEHKYLAELARTPWLALVVTTVAQMLYGESIYSSREGFDPKDAWSPWQRNRMGAKQIAIHRAALAYGLSYTTVLPGDRGAVINGVSPRDMLAVYADVTEDEYPMFGLRVTEQKGGRHIRLLDEERVYYLWQGDGERLEFIEDRVHAMGVCPVVRYANQLDLEGRAPGEVEPLIPLAAKINKTDYDRMLAQHYNSWKVRYATNLEEPPSQEDRDRVKLQLRQNDILTGEGDTQFGTLDATPLDGFIQAHDSDLEALGAASQTPVTAFGKLINVSAEGLLEARTSLYARRDERQMLFGESHCETLRLAAHAEGRGEDAEDFDLTLKWADTESRTLNQAVDALGKAAQMLGVPAEKLWEKIPGVDLTEAESWRQYRKEHPTPDEVTAQAVARQTAPIPEE